MIACNVAHVSVHLAGNLLALQNVGNTLILQIAQSEQSIQL